jgi:DNA repair exonuclease SbcCD nuclease subunit
MHNQDNLDYLDWFIDNMKKNKCNAVAFLGDWFENRSAINIETLEYSYRGLKKLDALNVPIFFIVGNHDLYRRNTREIHSVNIFQEFKNVVVIDKPTVIDNDFLFCPFIFENEYKNLAEHVNVPVWFGHFEFKGFVLTGHSMRAEHGINQDLFNSQKYIFSGHYHKRQANKNVIYIGNTFPTNFGDAGDTARGMMIYDHHNNSIDFLDWPNCPTYLKTTLSKALADDWLIRPNERMHVICTNDIELCYSEAQIVKETLKEQYKFREFKLEENYTERKEAVEDTTVEDTEAFTLDEFVITALESIKEVKGIKNDRLINIYKKL